MSRHILLTTDFSRESERAFLPVADLADLIGARVTLLHVIETAVALPHGAPMALPLPIPQAREREADAHRNLVEQAKRFPRDCEVATVVVTGPDVATAIVDYAEAHRTDLVAMASHGRGGLRRFVMGSIAETVVRRSTRPVMVYPPTREELASRRSGRAPLRVSG